MYSAQFNDFLNVFIVQGIVDYFPLASGSDESRLPEGLQLMRNRLLIHLQKDGNIADTHFGKRQRVQYADACCIAHNFVKISHFRPENRRHKLAADFLHNILMDNAAVTKIPCQSASPL